MTKSNDLARRVDRTVLSALRGADLAGVLSSGHRVRVTVACHGLDPDAVRRRVEEGLEEAGEDDLAVHVRYLAVHDGLRSRQLQTVLNGLWWTPKVEQKLCCVAPSSKQLPREYPGHPITSTPCCSKSLMTPSRMSHS